MLTFVDLSFCYRWNIGSKVWAALFALTTAMAACPAWSQTSVDLQLVLAVDVSGSVTEERFLLQQRGYAAAFRNARLLEAIKSGKNQGIAVTMTHWTGATQQTQVVSWTLVKDEDSMLAFADAIERATRQMFSGGTSISGAIDHAMALFTESGFASARRVIDISGDGANNRGRPPAEARDDAVRAGVSINGLPILALEPNLDQYYWDNVVGGPNAFVVVATSYETFAEAVVKKLITEVSSLRDRPTG
jgi:hypothetical protein